MAVSYYMNYVIYFTNRAEFDAARVAYGTDITTPPANAATLFGLTYPVAGGGFPAPEGKGIYYLHPYSPGTDIGFYFQSTVGVYFLDGAVPTITVPGAVDPFGNVYPDGIFTWVGAITLLGGGGVDVPPPAPVPIAQRRWAIGFELPDAGESAGPVIGSPSLNNVSRDSSRTAEGYGFCMRELNGFSNMPVTQYTGGGLSTVRSSWERLYIRVRRLPTGTRQMFWRAHGTPSALAGPRLSINPAGTLFFENIDSTNTVTQSATGATALLLNTWYRLDLLVEYTDGVTVPIQGQFRLFLNGGGELSQTVAPANGGLGAAGFHQSTDLGCNTGNFGLELDCDDWINADLPNASFTGLDWLTGSHVQRAYPTGFAASHNVAWVGDYRVNLQNPVAQSFGRLASSTSGARLALTTDAAAGPVSQFGAAAMTVGLYSSRVGAANGTLGYKVGAGGPVLATVTQQTTLSWTSVMYRPTGLVQPPPPYPPAVLRLEPVIFPIEIYFEKGASASAASVALLAATVEYIGAWGPEDGTIHDPLTPPILRSTDSHNAPYIQYELSGRAQSPIRAVLVHAGTYVGNGTGQDLSLPYPMHWYWVRRVPAVSNGPSHWHSSGLTMGWLNTDRVVPDGVGKASISSAGVSKFALSGANANLNESGQTYQFIALCDPGMRFLLAGAFMHGTAAASASMVNALQDAGFAPLAAFVNVQQVGPASNVLNYWYKGPGHAAQTAQKLGTAETTGVLTLGVGSLTSQTPLHVSQGLDGEASYVAMRVADGSGDPGVVLQILSYVGNAISPRVIALTPVSGRFPVFAMVVQHTGTMYFRDPSHVGADSSDANGGILTTAIVAGAIDQITVESSLNALGVTYDVFVIPGSPNGWNNGTFQPVVPIAGSDGGLVSGVFLSDPGPIIPPAPPPCQDSWGPTAPGGLPYVPLA